MMWLFGSVYFVYNVCVAYVVPGVHSVYIV